MVGAAVGAAVGEGSPTAQLASDDGAFTQSGQGSSATEEACSGGAASYEHVPQLTTANNTPTTMATFLPTKLCVDKFFTAWRPW